MPLMDSPTNPPPPKDPVTISVIGTGTGDGGGVAPTPNGTLAVTPGHQPNLIVQVVTPLMAITVRFINLFLTTFVGLLVAAMTPTGNQILGTGDFVHLVWVCAGLAFPGAALGFIKDLVTIFGRLEGKFPLLTGSI